jgi:hypothetical protein
MSSRREFLQRGLTASALAAFPADSLRALAGTSQPYRPLTVVYHRGGWEAASFGVEAQRRGIPAYAVPPDAGALWMNQIEPRLKRGPGALAGVTTLASQFCLELLARDYGMGLVYRARHAMEGGPIRHIITGPEELAGWKELLDGAGPWHWPTVAAAMAMSAVRTHPPLRGIELVDPSQPVRGRLLFSWVLAPKPGASVWGPAP